MATTLDSLTPQGKTSKKNGMGIFTSPVTMNNVLKNNLENPISLKDTEQYAKQNEIVNDELQTNSDGESFYGMNGKFIGMIGNGTEVRVATESDMEEVEQSVNCANDPELDQEGSQTYRNVAIAKSVALAIDHTEFQKLAGLASKEDHTNQETMNATAFAQRNRYASMNNGKQTATVTEVFNSFGGNRNTDLHKRMLKTRKLYKAYWKNQPIHRNTYLFGKKDIFVRGQKAVINAWLHPEKDNTNGATGWHGMDVLKPTKDSTAYENFQLEYGFKWDKTPIRGKGAVINAQNMPNHSGTNGQVLYVITAAYGSSIFYKSNPSK